MDEVVRYRQPDSLYSHRDRERYIICKTVLEARDVRRRFYQWRVSKVRGRRQAYRSYETASMFYQGCRFNDIYKELPDYH